MLNKKNKSKRRRFIRFPIALAGEVLLDKSLSLPCQILDFCNGGFFLAFKQTKPELALATNLKLRFVIGVEAKRESFSIDIRVVYVSASGAGVSADDLPVLTYNALLQAANNGANAAMEDRRSSSSTANKINQAACKKTFKHWLTQKLPPLLGQFFTHIRADLEKSVHHADVLMNSSVLDDLLTNFELKREAFVSEMCNSVLSHVDFISAPQAEIRRLIHGKFPALSAGKRGI